MSRIEIFLVALVCAVPLVAFILMAPKLKKKEKKVETVKTLAEVKEEEKELKPKVEEDKLEEKQIKTISNEISTDEFEDYIARKKQNITKPQRIELPKDFVDRTSPYLPRRRDMRDQKPKNVAEEIKSLSPELKALIIAGVLDKKDYD